ncbi:hypothetical protein HHI36_018592 [Cryptolaemus montrouzieri]|uniref:Uncharacterized protein n=1 Tax=Cryptolaemus montrouzieri TaxID=559131 RepID=A0ABD2P0H6_9CUCU
MIIYHTKREYQMNGKIEILISNSINRAIISEHWIREANTDQLKMQEYKVAAHFSRKQGYGGALSLNHKEENHMSLPLLRGHSKEGEIEVDGNWMKTHKIIIMPIYRPPSGTIEAFID